GNGRLNIGIQLFCSRRVAPQHRGAGDSGDQGGNEDGDLRGGEIGGGWGGLRGGGKGERESEGRERVRARPVWPKIPGRVAWRCQSAPPATPRAGCPMASPARDRG